MRRGNTLCAIAYAQNISEAFTKLRTMNPTIYNQLLTDTQAYITTQYKLLQVKGIKQTSRILSMIIAVVVTTTLVVIGHIFLAIALAAWLEQWLPMWASYLIIAGITLLIALAIYWGRKLWFVRPIEKRISQAVMNDITPLQQIQQSIENQSAMQRELLERDIENIQQEWSQIERILYLIRSVFS
jgi:uncharacterized membrane protein